MDRNLPVLYSKEKNKLLLLKRGIGFEDIVMAIEEDCVVDDVVHFNQKAYPNQRIIIIVIKQEAYLVPYVVDEARKQIYLKTIYPSRKFQKKYAK